MSAAQQLRKAIKAHEQGNLVAAAGLYEEVIRTEPNNATAISNLAVIAMSRRDYVTAEQYLWRALAIKEDAGTYSNLGVVLRARGRLRQAIAAYRRAIELKPEFVDAYHNLGNALREDGQADAAANAYRRVIQLRANSADAYNSLGNALRDAGHLQEAIAAYKEAIQLKPHNAEAYNNYAAVLQDQGRLDEAIATYQHVVGLRADYPAAYSNLGAALRRQSRRKEAIAAYRQAIKLKPDFADAWGNLGNALQDDGQLEETIAAYERATELRPDYADALSQLVHQRQHACIWTNFEADQARLLEIVRSGKSAIAPFVLLAATASAADQLLCAQKWAQGVRRKVPQSQEFQHASIGSKGKIKIGYLSADFYEHATSYLAAELFERHDRSRFAITGYSYGPDDHSDMRRRVVQAFDEFVDIRKLSHAEAASRIHQDKIDILVDLKGYTVHARTEILAYRPAPLQVNYLGYPGTMGADFVDYIITDAFIAPDDNQQFYSEKLIHLPHCYQPNDSKRQIAQRTPSRAECGLPENAFVFCSFNNSYKITPAFFGIWMRLLSNVHGSVLWLLKSNGLVEKNLKREAENRDIDPQRLIFAPRRSLAEHLARHRQADLFLDTLPCNAHTTASDALWAGLPIITCSGNTFAGRVAGSLLHAAGLAELVTSSAEDYEAVALALARSPDRLADCRRKLEDRLSSPLFDICHFTKTLEAAYQTMCERWYATVVAI
jgi:predicted O-linked N-acetylglucosamine transferase (SPINDLY family)